MRRSGQLSFIGEDGVLAALTMALAVRALNPQLDAHLTEEHADPPPDRQNQAPNHRNGGSLT